MTRTYSFVAATTLALFLMAAISLPAGHRLVAQQSQAPTQEKQKSADKPAEDKAGKGEEPKKLKEKLREAEQQAALLKEQVLAEQAVSKSLKAELDRRNEEVDGHLKKVDVKKNTVSLTISGTKLVISDIPLASNAKFFLDVVDKQARVHRNECTIDDLKEGMQASLQLTDDDKSVIAVVRVRKYEKD